MVWSPTYKTVRCRAIADNLLAYIAANQADAILWANGSTLRELQDFITTVTDREKPIYPFISFLTDEDDQDFAGDMTDVGYEVTFQMLVQGSSPVTAKDEAEMYAAAVKSMIRNCPSPTVTVNTGADLNGTVLLKIRSKYDETGGNELQNDFGQTVLIVATYTLKASAFE